MKTILITGIFFLYYFDLIESCIPRIPRVHPSQPKVKQDKHKDSDGDGLSDDVDPDDDNDGVMDEGM